MERKTREYNIVIPCPIHKNKAIEYLCTHPSPHTRNLFCTSCIFKKTCCQHDDDLQDLTEFLNEQRQQFRRHGLLPAPEVSEALDAREDFLQNCKDQAQIQVEKIEQHFDFLIHKVVLSLNQAKDEAIKTLEKQIERFTKAYKILDVKVRQNFHRLFFSSKFKTFEEMIKNFMPFTFENISLMANALRENYEAQKTVSDDIMFSYEQVMSFQRDAPVFDLDKFDTLQNQLNTFMEDLKKVTPNLINSAIPHAGDLDAAVVESFVSSKVLQTPPEIRKSAVRVRSQADISSALRDVDGKFVINTSFVDRQAETDPETKRSKSTMRISSTRLPIGRSLSSLIKEPPASHRKKDKRGEERSIRGFNEKQLVHLKSFDTGHSRTVFSIAYLGERLMASGSDDGLIKIWNLDKSKCVNVLRGHTAGVRALTMLDSKNLVSASWDRTIKIWNTSALVNAEMARNQTALQNPGSDGSDTDEDEGIQVTCLKTLKAHTNAVLCLGVLPDGKTLVSGSSDNSIKLWDSESGLSLRTMFGHMNEVECLVATQYKPYIVSGSGDRTIKVWNYQTKKSSSPCVRTLEGHTGFVWCMALMNDDYTLVSGSQDNVIRVWNIDTGECLKVLVGHLNQVLTVKLFKPNIIMSGDAEGVVKLWNMHNSCVLISIKANKDKQAVNSLEVTDDFMMVGTGADKKISIWA